MYIHLGRDTVVSAREVVGVLDLDTSTFSKHTKNFLTSCEKKGRVINICDDLPRSVVVVSRGGQQLVYISQLSTRTLLKRAQGLQGI